MRRKDRERDAAFAWQVMTAAPYATLSLVDESGKGAWEQGGCIYFHCALAGKKYELFKDGCAAAMSAVSRAEVIPNEYTVAYASAVVRGRLEVVTSEEERMHAMEVLCRRFDPAAGEKFMDCMKNAGARTCVARLTVEEITGKEGNG